MNKTAFVTGASKGIGKAIAFELARNGMNVIVGCKTSITEAEEVASQLARYNVRSIAVKGDIGDYVSVKNMFDYIYSVFPQVDVMVNNAGISLVKPIMDTTYDEWIELVNVNLTSIYNTTKFVLPKMCENGFGRIINISSIWGEIGASCEVAYSACKAGVIGFTKALAKEVPPRVTVNCIAPGIIYTEMNATLSEAEVVEFLKGVPASRMGKAEEIASLVSYLASENSGYTSGQIIGVNGGMC
ncbi:MAG: SDR family NAD(P)-dependent oxidoreductase [Clostridia bacterium]|nr:SDR family NAD(P)-dependent oxidoreductase [Clostridia bacterium]